MGLDWLPCSTPHQTTPGVHLNLQATETTTSNSVFDSYAVAKRARVSRGFSMASVGYGR